MRFYFLSFYTQSQFPIYISSFYIFCLHGHCCTHQPKQTHSLPPLYDICIHLFLHSIPCIVFIGFSLHCLSGGPQFPGCRLAPACEPPGRRAGGEWQAGKQSVISICSHSPSLPQLHLTSPGVRFSQQHRSLGPKRLRTTHPQDHELLTRRDSTYLPRSSHFLSTVPGTLRTFSNYLSD